MKESEEFLCLPINQLIDIISSDELNMTCEEDVFNAVMQWISYDLQQRKQYLFKVHIFAMGEKSMEGFFRSSNMSVFR